MYNQIKVCIKFFVVESVDSFSYLSFVMHFNGKLNITQKHIADQAKKSVFLLLKQSPTIISALLL